LPILRLTPTISSVRCFESTVSTATLAYHPEVVFGRIGLQYLSNSNLRQQFSGEPLLRAERRGLRFVMAMRLIIGLGSLPFS